MALSPICSWRREGKAVGECPDKGSLIVLAVPSMQPTNTNNEVNLSTHPNIAILNLQNDNVTVSLTVYVLVQFMVKQ